MNRKYIILKMGAYLSDCKVKATDLYDDTMNCVSKYLEEYEIIGHKDDQNNQHTNIYQGNDQGDDGYELGNLEKKNKKEY